MKDTLYTIPLTDAFSEHDECPFCYIRRKLEQDSLDFILGGSSAYMESDIRDLTNKYGFCSDHYQKMLKYGNSLGNAIMLQSYLRTVKKDLSKKMNAYTSDKTSILDKFKKKSSDEAPVSSIHKFTKQTTDNCFVCKKINDTFDRYVDTFFFLFQSKEEFRDLFKNGKGFCMRGMQNL